MPDTVMMQLRMMGGKVDTLDGIPRNTKIRALKEMIAALPNFPPAARQRLLAGGFAMTDDEIIGTRYTSLSHVMVIDTAPIQAAAGNDNENNDAFLPVAVAEEVPENVVGDGDGELPLPLGPNPNANPQPRPPTEMRQCPRMLASDPVQDQAPEHFAKQGEPVDYPAKWGPLMLVQLQIPANITREQQAMDNGQDPPKHKHAIHVPEGAPIGWIKHNIVAPGTGVGGLGIKLFAMTKELGDEETPRSTNLNRLTMLHMLLCYNKPPDGPVRHLRFCCKYCQTVNARILLVPICRKCKQASILVPDFDARSPDVTWGSLAGHTGECLVCSGTHPVSFKGVCDNRHTPDYKKLGIRCVTRAGGNDHRLALFVTTGEPSDNLRVANEVYGYSFCKFVA